MSVKLSELLKVAIEEIEARASADELAEGYGSIPPMGGWDSVRHLVALRAIAPALVELVATKNAINGLDTDHDHARYKDLAPRLMNAWDKFLSAMKEAGVTCE